MAMIAEAFASQFAETLITMAKGEVTMMLGVKGELLELEKRLDTIRAVLEDAECKAFTKNAIRTWLANLRDVLYAADDVLDHYWTRVEQRARLSSDGSVPYYSPSHLFSCFSRMLFRYQTGRRIRSINEKLERIIKDQSGFGLITAAFAGGDHGRSSINRQTDPLLEPDIVGMQIENDTSHLNSLLMTKHYDCVHAVPVVAIVGMGGIGKTTLAQKVYNHPTIKDNFRMPPPMWVCVSQDYLDTDLLKNVIRCAGGDPATCGQSFSELELLLAEVIEQKKFLLILDDVWSAQVWNDLLRKPLQRAAIGSRILITTRDENVAKLMGAVHLHSVQVLSVQDGWSLLSKKVLQGGGDRGALEDIGVDIVNKCGCLPLAIKTIAGVLMVKERTRQEWERVLNNPAWSLTDLPDGVMGALYLSYQDLPFHLKQCFIYCSLFPEDSTILTSDLVGLWIANVLVGGDTMEMEEVAKGYYKELLRRNLLQSHPQYYDINACSMHDLLRSLALFLAGEEIFVGDIKGLSVKASASASTKLRHLFLVDNSLNSIPNVLKDCKFLRTLHLESESLVDFPLYLFKKLKQLRVFEVKCKNVKRLPETVQNLVHLRRLDLSLSSITELPETIVNLSNLQYLGLNGCPNLHKLPKGVTKLYNLRGLNLHETPVSGLPAGIGRLQRLRYMNGFVTNESFDGRRGTGARSHEDGWCCMEELGSLSQLRLLSIMNIERAVFVVKARGGFLLKDKSHLTTLELNCAPSRADGQPYGDEEVKRIQEMFEEELHPPNSLQHLFINGFFGLQFPSWMTNRISEVLFNLRLLELKNCRLCKQLPPFVQLPNLDYLKIEDLAAVETVGPEFFGFGGSGERCAQPSSCIPFPKSEELTLKNFPNWVDWMWEPEPEPEDGAIIAMPCLQKLFLRSCPKMRSLPKGIHALTNLHSLVIEGANSLTTVENHVCVKHLEIKENTNLVRLSNLPALQELFVESCPALRDMGILCSLRFLQFKDLLMQSLPEWLMPREGKQQPFPALEKLKIIAGGVHILQRCLKGGPDWPKIQHFFSVRIYVDEKPEFLSYTRDPFSFNVNMGANDGEGSGSSDIRHHN